MITWIGLNLYGKYRAQKNMLNNTTGIWSDISRMQETLQDLLPGYFKKQKANSKKVKEG